MQVQHANLANESDQYLDQHAFLCSTRIRDYDTPVPKHVEV